MILRFAENDLKWDLMGGGIVNFPLPHKNVGKGANFIFSKNPSGKQKISGHFQF